MRFFIYLVFLSLLSACTPSSALYTQTAYIFGTKVDITIYGLNEEHAKKHIAHLFRDFEAMHQKLHAWQKSALTDINTAFKHQRAITIDTEMKNWLQNAQYYAQATDQLFNPALGQLLKTWGFQSEDFLATPPPATLIQQWVKSAPSLEDLVFKENLVQSTNPAVSLDLGGIAKGWALDQAAAYLQKNHVKNALINIGGNVLALGKKGETPWTVGLQDPRYAEPMALLSLHDGEAIGTSGDYQRYFIHKDIRYSHLIDPRTGFPAQKMMSATVIAPPGLSAGTLSDIATKPLFIDGVSHAGKYLNRFSIKDTLLITAENKTYLSLHMEKRIKWLRKPTHIYHLF